MKKREMQKKAKAKAPAASAKSKAGNHTLLLIGITLLFTLIAYLPVLKAGFVNWDDDDYVLNNLLIRNWSNIKELITVSVQGNYHPLTILSLALNYSVSGMEPWSYHALNLLLHLANTFLVFLLASRLSNRNALVSFTTALLFGIHPMHVESVAWVSERKDVLYAFFFLLGLLSYINYIKKNSRSSYVLSVVWFLLSLASKPAAIIFPVVLFTIDFFSKRKMSVRLVTEKIPYFLFAAFIAYLTITAQKTVGATDTKAAFPLENRIFFMFYGYMMYFFKMIVPLNMAAYYPLPPVNESLPVIYFIAPVFFLLTVVLCVMTWKKYRVVTFGFAFYLINLVLVLQFYVVGSAVMADRYTYVPYIGLFFLFGWVLNEMIKQKRNYAYSIIMVIGLLLTYATYEQAGTWFSSATLWNNAIQKVPSDHAYVNRAMLFRADGQADKAVSYYTQALHINKINHEAYCNRGNIYFDKGEDSLALADYNQALNLKPDLAAALDNRGELYSRQGKYDLGLADFNRALQLKPEYKAAYIGRALLNKDLKQYESAIRDFEKYLSYEPGDAEVYNIVGVCYQSLGKYDQSFKPINDAIRLTNSPMYYLNRSISWSAIGNIEEARRDAQYAKERGVKIPESYALRLEIY